MGNYQEYLKRIAPPLREIESTPVRQHMFGNPFKIDKVCYLLFSRKLMFTTLQYRFLIFNFSQRMMVDEADIDLVGGSATQSGGRGIKRPAESPSPSPLRPSKRKAGPLSRDVCIRRPFSPVSSSNASNVPLGSNTSNQSIPSLLDLQTRPDSPLPGACSSVLYSPSTASIDSEEESGSLVIAEYDTDFQPENPILLNGKDTLVGKMQENLHSPSMAPVPPLSLDSEGSRTSSEVSTGLPTPLPLRLANGDTKSIQSCNTYVDALNYAILIILISFVSDIHLDHDGNNSSVPMVNGLSKTETQKTMSSNGLPVISLIDIQEILQHNLDVKTAAYKAIKRPGRSK